MFVTQTAGKVRSEAVRDTFFCVTQRCRFKSRLGSVCDFLVVVKHYVSSINSFKVKQSEILPAVSQLTDYKHTTPFYSYYLIYYEVTVGEGY